MPHLALTLAEDHPRVKDVALLLDIADAVYDSVYLISYKQTAHKVDELDYRLRNPKEYIPPDDQIMFRRARKQRSLEITLVGVNPVMTVLASFLMFAMMVAKIVKSLAEAIKAEAEAKLLNEQRRRLTEIRQAMETVSFRTKGDVILNAAPLLKELGFDIDESVVSNYSKELDKLVEVLRGLKGPDHVMDAIIEDIFKRLDNISRIRLIDVEIRRG